MSPVRFGLELKETGVKFKNSDKEDSNLKNCVTRTEQVGQEASAGTRYPIYSKPSRETQSFCWRGRSPLQDGSVIRKRNKSASGPILPSLKYSFGGLSLLPAPRALTQGTDIVSSRASTRWCGHLSPCPPRRNPLRSPWSGQTAVSHGEDSSVKIPGT